VTLRDDLEEIGARLVPHSDNVKARIWNQCSKIGGVKDFSSRFWITLAPDICYPSTVRNPWAPVYEATIRHEMTHIRQQKRDGLYWWLVKYLASQDFRWRQEREAYLCDLRAGENSARSIAETLHDVYRIYTPTVEQMVVWLEAHR